MSQYKVDGKMIREIREKRGWRAADLAERLDSNAQYIYRIERNEDRPSFDFLLQIASALEVPFSILLENGHGGNGGVLSVGVLNFDVPPELVEPIIKLISMYHKK